MWLEFKECTEKAVVTLRRQQTALEYGRVSKKASNARRCRTTLLTARSNRHWYQESWNIHQDTYSGQISEWYFEVPENSVANKHASNITKAKYEITTGT